MKPLGTELVRRLTGSVPVGRSYYYLKTGPDGRVLGYPEILITPGARISYVDKHGRFGLYVWEHPEGISVKWPVRVFRVTDIDEVRRSGFARRIHVCRAVTVVDEIPAWRIFGANGATVVRLVEQAAALDEESVGRFAPPLPEANAWVITHNEARDDGGTLSAAIIVRDALYDAARRSPVALFETREVWDSEAGTYMTEVLVDPRWKAALSAAWCAAYGFAAKPFIDARQFQVLTSAWITALGRPVEYEVGHTH